MNNDVLYSLAKFIIDALKAKGLITQEEYIKIDEKNIVSFSLK